MKKKNKSTARVNPFRGAAAAWDKNYALFQKHPGSLAVFLKELVFDGDVTDDEAIAAAELFEDDEGRLCTEFYERSFYAWSPKKKRWEETV